MPRELRLSCPPGFAPGRLDVFLAKSLTEFSREHLKLLIEQGHVTVDGKPCKPASRLSGGETVVVRVPDPVAVALEAEEVALDVCFEDEHLLVVNKPRGMLTHPASGRTTVGTLVNALLGHCKDLGGIHGELRPGIVHRLDRETTGLLVVAKTDVVQRLLAAQFQARTVVKNYFALVHGAVVPAHGFFRWAIARHPVHRTRMRVDEDRGRAALTEFLVVARFPDTTLVRVRLHTGRTHQIRVHFSYAKHPLVGDVAYGARAGIFAGVALHSARLRFTHPVTGNPVVCSRPLPPDFCELLRRARGGLA
ncbi:MAG: RluA family pseudouridine synthase [Candidatus Wallbacteria bacterium]|nr:RluA family pseudouridine synthase [Candidatus Wallbacteria bacterium]